MEVGTSNSAPSDHEHIRSIAVIGAGRIGALIAEILRGLGFAVTSADREIGLEGADEILDVTDEAALHELVARVDAVVSCLPYDLNARVARAAHAAGVYYFDPTEDVRTTKLVEQLGQTATAAMIPQCGIAPGFICIVAAALAEVLDEVDSLTLRAGALPRHPANALGYAFTWSPVGVINQYLEPCDALQGGRLTMLPPLEDVERVIIDGTSLEAFTTSGGNGTLCTSLSGKVGRLNYKTLRYPGHRDLIRFFLDELGMGAQRELATEMLARACPPTDDDVMYVHVEARGRKDGGGACKQFVRAYRPRAIAGRPRTAIGWTTACGLCSIVELVASGQIAETGFVRQEHIRLADVHATRTGALLVDETGGVAATPVPLTDLRTRVRT